MQQELDLSQEFLHDAESLFKQIIEQIINELCVEFPKAEFLLEGETYHDEDAIIKIYAPENDLNSLSDKASELSLDLELKTGYFILTMVNAIGAYPIR